METFSVLPLVALTFGCIASLAQAPAAPPSAPPATGLELRNAARMTAEDSQLVFARTRDIAHSAEIYGYALDGSWSYQQTICPVAPNHVLLNYQHTEPNGAKSSFSAVVPRQRQVVQIFPILRSGMLPFVQPWGEHSYAVFNSLVSQERKATKTFDMDSAFSLPWKDWALCYVALVTTPLVNSQAPFQLASEITVSIHDRGLADVGFAAGDGDLSYSDWSLKFSPKGVLVKTFREQHLIVYAPAGTDLAGPKGKFIPEPAAPPTAMPDAH